MNSEERNALIAERENLEETIRKADFIDPRDMRRMDEIWSLLFTDGANTTTRLVPGKIKKSHRVTSFTRDRR
jgi:hypothetical protein